MTEQQILDKTIEYLNKYSITLACWSYYEHSDYIMVKNNYNSDNYQLKIEDLTANIIDVYFSYSDINEYGCKYEAIMHSEFRIAYNIIKDLAQHGINDNAVNALG